MTTQNKVQIFQGDCLDLFQAIPDNSVDMVLCDPPYGTTEHKWDTVIPYDELWGHLYRITKKNAAIVLMGVQPFSAALAASNLKHLRYSWYWHKSVPQGFLNAKKRPLKDIEEILVFYDEQPTYNPQGLKKTFKKNQNGRAFSESHGMTGDAYFQTHENYPRQLIEIPNESKTVHPTQKPVALMKYLISTYTNRGDIVVDFTMGSGTTGVACVELGRRFIGFEKTEEFFAIAQERISNAKFEKPYDITIDSLF